MDLKLSILLTYLVGIWFCSTDEYKERIVTMDVVELDGRCCMKTCLEEATDADCNAWKQSVIRINKQQGELTEERVANIEKKQRKAIKLLDEAEQNKKARIEVIRENANRTFQMKKKALIEELNADVERVRSECRPKLNRTDCRNVSAEDAKVWNGTGGVFDIITESGNNTVEVYCDVTTDGGGWIVFQRRMDGSVDFFRNWTNYVNGFGDSDKEMWLGLENLHQLTIDGEYELRIDLGNWSGDTAYAKYGVFSVGNASDNYRLNVSQYTGNAGDSFTYHDGMQFSTYDRNNHVCDRREIASCARLRRGAWWYKCCAYSNLNGIFHDGGESVDMVNDGVMWSHWNDLYEMYHHYAYEYHDEYIDKLKYLPSRKSLKFTEMKFRRKN